MQSKKNLIFFLILLMLPRFASAIDWQIVKPGLEFAAEQKIYFYKISPKYFKPRLLFDKDSEFKSRSIRDLDSFNGIIVNANFFGQNYQPLGLMIDNFKTINPLQTGGKLLSAIFAYDGSRYSIFSRSEQRDNLQLAIQAGPMLFSNNKPVKIVEKQSPARRSGVCLDADASPIIFITAPGEVLSLSEVQKNIIIAQVNCKFGINFDGGSSSQLQINLAETEDLENLPRQVYGLSQVPVFLGFIPVSP